MTSAFMGTPTELPQKDTGHAQPPMGGGGMGF
jgi:hypothetical protein